MKATVALTFDPYACDISLSTHDFMHQRCTGGNGFLCKFHHTYNGMGDSIDMDLPEQSLVVLYCDLQYGA